VQAADRELIRAQVEDRVPLADQRIGQAEALVQGALEYTSGR
jgi:hypothetical protein